MVSVRAVDGRKLIDATPKDDIGLIRRRVAERDNFRAAIAHTMISR